MYNYEKINPQIFRGYDIRGIYGKDLTEKVAYKIGNIYGQIILEKGFSKVIVGRDNRFSSETLQKSLIDGILDSGASVIDIGLVTSPILYYTNEIFNIRQGIMVTASHNPKEYNGFKIAIDEKGEICGQEIEVFRDCVLNLKVAKVERKGILLKISMNDLYTNMFVQKFSFNKKQKLIIDCGNGTASIIAQKIFDNFSNLECKYICSTSDPSFPIHHPDPAEPENLKLLQEIVLKEKADLGIAFDGDCDRVGFVDDKGRIVDADYMLAIFAKNIIPKIKNKTVFFDVSCSKTLADEIRKAGGIPICYKTGHSYIKREMLKQGGLFGGEISGHTFFKDKFYGFDDGIYAALRMVELLEETNKSMSYEVDSLVKYNSSPVIKLKVREDVKAKVIEDFKKYCTDNNYNVNLIDGARIEEKDYFVICRMSNTTPKITIRFEGNTAEKLKEIYEKFIPVINNIIAKNS